MRDPWFRQQQEANLRAPHVAPINALVDELIDTAGRGWVPYVSPLYGGVNARLLNVHRDPGPKTDCRQGGSGFLCTENDDASAERFATLLEDAGITVSRDAVLERLSLVHQQAAASSRTRGGCRVQWPCFRLLCGNVAVLWLMMVLRVCRRTGGCRTGFRSGC